MADELNKVGTGYIPPSQDVQTALDMPMEQLEAQVNQTVATRDPQQHLNEVPVVRPEISQTQTAPVTVPATTGQAQEEGNKQEVQPVAAVETVPKVERPVTFEELQAKTGVKSPDALAKNYTELVRELQRMKQAEAEKRRTETYQTMQPAIPQATPTDNSNLVNQLLENPEMTLAQAFLKMNEVANAPLREKNAVLERSLKFKEMASSPETADFADPEIQEAMTSEFKTRPDWIANQETVNAHIEDAYWMARGKVKAKAELKAFQEGQRRGEQAVLQKKASAVEGAGNVSLNTGSGSTDPKVMPLGDLEKLIYSQLQG